MYPTGAQAAKLAVQFGCARFVWNHGLEASQTAYRETGKGLGYHALSTALPKLKQEMEWLKDADAQVLQQSLQNLAAAYEGFFAKRARYPRFKSKRGRQSIRYPQRVKLDGNRIYLPKVGWVRCVVHREIVGRIKSVTVSRNPSGRFHASILTEDDRPMSAVSTDGKAIGIDLGLTDFAVTSDGSKFSNPRHLARAEKNLKRKQRKLSRKVKGSRGRAKACRLLARAHERVADARKDYLHKLSRRIVNENQVIVVESLNVQGMARNRSLAKAISDVGWGEFTRQLAYKAEREGKAFVRVDRWYPSSKACSECGAIRDSLPLGVRRWECSCGAVHDRDINAARNIRAEGLRLLAGGMPASAGGGTVRRRTRETACAA